MFTPLAWAALAVALVTSAATCAVIAFTPIGRRFLDKPNARSLHATPTPRGGGVGVWVGLLAGLAVYRLAQRGAEEPIGPPMAGLFGVVTVLVVLGVVDDRQGLRAPIRLGVQAATVAAFLIASGVPQGTIDVFGWVVRPGVPGLLIALLATLWMLNLYNFMDGMDGFAGAMTATGFLTLGWLALQAGQFTLAMTAALPAAAALGFLVWNLPPARLFLGDSGSVPLGFIAAAVALWGVVRGVWSPMLPVVVFAPFILDATVTLIRRLLRGDRVWEAHRSHVYQRLVLAGLGHRRTLALEVGFMIAAAALALIVQGRGARAEILAFAGVLAMYAGGFAAAQRLERRGLEPRDPANQR